MKKFVLAAIAALSLGMGVASAATVDHPNWPTVIQNGPPAASPSFGAGGSYSTPITNGPVIQ